MNDEGKSVFARYIEEPEQREPELVWMSKETAETTWNLTPAQQLLNWLQHDWTAPTIRAREIYRHAPRPIRNRNSGAIGLAKMLVERGWLAPLKTRRRDVKAWQIMRGPSR